MCHVCGMTDPRKARRQHVKRYNREHFRVMEDLRATLLLHRMEGRLAPEVYHAFISALDDLSPR